MADDLRARALALYKPPFRFTHGYIFDSAHNMVADQGGVDEMADMVAARVRGWGRIGSMPGAAALQDTVGEMVAEALDEFWARSAERVAAPAGAPGATDAERAAWLADKIGALGDYAKEAAAMLRRWPADVAPSDAPSSDAVLGEVRNLAAHGSMYLQEREYGHARTAFDLIVQAVDAARALGVAPSDRG